MAIEKGFFNKHGIDIRLLEGGPDANVHQIVAEKKADFGILGSELVLFRVEHPELVVLAPIMQHSIRAIIGRKDMGIDSIHDLYNKELLLNFNEVPEFKAMLNNEGISIDKLHFRHKTDSALDQLIKGEVSAINGSIANQPYRLIQAEIPFTLIRPINYGIDFYGDSLFTTRELINSKPEIVLAVKSAVIEGWEYAFNNPDETIDLIIQKYNSKKSREHLYFEYSQLEKLIQPQLVEIGHNNPLRWERIVKTYKDLNLLDEEYNLNGFFYDPEKEHEYFLKNLSNILFIVLGAVFVVLIIIFSFNKQLTKTIKIRTSELENSRDYLRSVIDSMPMEILAVSAEGEITQWNNQAASITGLDRRKVIGSNIKSITKLDLELTDIQEAFTNNTVLKLPVKRIVLEKQVNYFKTTIYPIKTADIQEIIIILENISQEVKLQDALIQNEKMYSLGTMVAGLAHEIKGPLSGITQCAALLESRLGTELGNSKNVEILDSQKIPIDKLRFFLEKRSIIKYLKSIISSSLSLSEIISNTLSFSRKPELSYKSVSVQNIFSNAKQLLELEEKDVKYKNIEIQMTADQNLPVLYCQQTKIQQVLYNILRNAVFELRRSKIPQPKISVHITTENSNMKIVIRDNGPGMTDDIKSKIFTPFFSTKDSENGTGLGLSVCYSIITNDHKGHISVESSPGSGAAFIIKLPLE